MGVIFELIVDTFLGGLAGGRPPRLRTSFGVPYTVVIIALALLTGLLGFRVAVTADAGAIWLPFAIAFVGGFVCGFLLARGPLNSLLGGLTAALGPAAGMMAGLGVLFLNIFECMPGWGSADCST